MEINGILLVGGRSSRLGRDKSLEIIGGESLIERAVNALAPLCKTVILVAAVDTELKSVTETPSLRIVTDIYPRKGPLVGLYSGLEQSDTLYNLVIACDMPFLSEKLIRLMIELAPGYDAVVPRPGKKAEPLCAVFSRNCLTTIEKMMEDGDYTVRHIPQKVITRYVNAKEIASADPEYRSFINVNREEDLAQARELAEGLSGDGE